jgi:hypothetical protein
MRIEAICIGTLSDKARLLKATVVSNFFSCSSGDSVMMMLPLPLDALGPV